MSKRLIYEEDAIDAVRVFYADECALVDSIEEQLEKLPSAHPEGYIKIPETGIDDLSDGFHTFRQLYYQRMMLFATIVKQNKDKAWKSLRHEDGELCFGGGWFIVGIDTPEGSYTYHYEDNYFSLFDCEELERGKHWDGHTEKDVTRLLSLPSTQPEDICSECDAWNVYKNYAQPKWIPVSERLPDDIRPVIVTWCNTDPASYYQHIVGKRFTGVAHYKSGKWYWYSSTTEDFLAEYGRYDVEEFDEAIEVLAWCEMPEPYKGEQEWYQ